MKFLEKELGGTVNGEFLGEMRKNYLEGRPENNIERMKQFWERKVQANNAPAPAPAMPK